MKIAFKRSKIKIWPLRTPKLFLNINEIKTDPFLNTILAQYQIDLNEFITEFNLQATQIFLDNIEIPIVITKTPELAEFLFKFPTISWLLSQTLQFDAENGFNYELNFFNNINNNQQFFDYFKFKNNFFFSNTKSNKNLDLYKYKRISIPYLFLWDMVWWLSDLKFLTRMNTTIYLIGSFRSLRCFVRIEKRLAQFGTKSYGFLNAKERSLKIGKKKLKFKFIIYRFYKLKLKKKKLNFNKKKFKKKIKTFFLNFFFKNLNIYENEDQEILSEIIFKFKFFSNKVKKNFLIILNKKIKN
jgi:ribosomal protein L11